MTVVYKEATIFETNNIAVFISHKLAQGHNDFHSQITDQHVQQ